MTCELTTATCENNRTAMSTASPYFRWSRARREPPAHRPAGGSFANAPAITRPADSRPAPGHQERPSRRATSRRGCYRLGGARRRAGAVRALFSGLGAPRLARDRGRMPATRRAERPDPHTGAASARVPRVGGRIATRRFTALAAGSARALRRSPAAGPSSRHRAVQPRRVLRAAQDPRGRVARGARPGPLLYQGILQIGIGFEHLRRGNPRGAQRLWRRGISSLEPFKPGCMKVDVDRLVADTERCLADSSASASAALSASTARSSPASSGLRSRLKSSPTGALQAGMRGVRDRSPAPHDRALHVVAADLPDPFRVGLPRDNRARPTGCADIGGGLGPRAWRVRACRL